MNTNTRLFIKHFQPTLRVVLLTAGVAIAWLTLPTFSNDEIEVPGQIDSKLALTIPLSEAVAFENTKPGIGYHNFLASYFIQETSFDRSSKAPSVGSAPVITMMKLPFSVAINVWSTVGGH